MSTDINPRDQVWLAYLDRAIAFYAGASVDADEIVRTARVFFEAELGRSRVGAQ